MMLFTIDYKTLLNNIKEKLQQKQKLMAFNKDVQPHMNYYLALISMFSWRYGCVSAICDTSAQAKKL